MASRLSGRGRVTRLVASPIANTLEAIALGVMHPKDVDQMVCQTYQSRPNFYDPHRYELTYEARLLPVLVEHRPKGKMLDAFCGQGREAKLFAEAGYDVVAIDRLQWMIDAAKRYAKESEFDAKFEAADFARYQPLEPFDITYTSCWMYSTVQGTAARASFLTRLKELTRQDGLAVVSYVSGRSDGRAGVLARWLISRVVGAIAFGNRDIERGERIYTGLFWHHLPDEVAEHEVRQSGWDIVDRVEGEQMEPTFLLLRRATSEAAK
ncbi:MAG: methyltransferase domain-containing protein [Planctomycetota bacterium]